MRGHEQSEPKGRTIAAPLPPVPERLIRRRAPHEQGPSMEESIAIEYCGLNHGLSAEEITRVAFVYAKAYKAGVDSMVDVVEGHA